MFIYIFIEARGPTFLWFLKKKKYSDVHVQKKQLYYDSWLSGSVEGGGPIPLHVASPVATASLSASSGSAATSSASAASTSVMSDSCAAWVLHPLLSPWGWLRPHLLLWRLEAAPWSLPPFRLEDADLFNVQVHQQSVAVLQWVDRIAPPYRFSVAVHKRQSRRRIHNFEPVVPDEEQFFDVESELP